MRCARERTASSISLTARRRGCGRPASIWRESCAHATAIASTSSSTPARCALARRSCAPIWPPASWCRSPVPSSTWARPFRRPAGAAGDRRSRFSHGAAARKPRSLFQPAGVAVRMERDHRRPVGERQSRSLAPLAGRAGGDGGLQPRSRPPAHRNHDCALRTRCTPASRLPTPWSSSPRKRPRRIGRRRSSRCRSGAATRQPSTWPR